MDRMAQEKIYYDRYEVWLVPLIVISLAALAVFLFCVVVLTIGAGRRNEDEEVHLNFFDRWYTEVAAVLVVFVGLYGMAVVLNMIGTEMLMLWVLIIMGMLGMWFGVWFLIGWLSLVRRIKARSLWKDSLLRHILLKIRKYFRRLGSITDFFRQNLKSRLKTVILFGIFAFAGFIFTGIGVGGSSPVGLLLLLVLDATILFYLLKKAYGRELIQDGLEKITGGELQYKIPLEKLTGEQQQIAEHINHIGEGLDAAVEDSLRNERMKTELITNVSHDLKTPLTSIINYVDLLKRENPEDPKIQKYIAVLENVFGNVTKYAMANTRVYAEVSVERPKVRFSLKNISAQPLNITAEELTERFVRGDVSRNTEGSGLGLSIAQSLTELQGGEFKVYVDGDLFKITIIFQMKEK